MFNHLSIQLELEWELFEAMIPSLYREFQGHLQDFSKEVVIFIYYEHNA